MPTRRKDIPSAVPEGGSPGEIARQLTGDLWCIGCGYNLRGLSIRERCPECGVPVRATILGVVDPKAHELTPLGRPRLVGVGLVAWTTGLWVAAMSVAVMRAAEVMREVLGSGWRPWLSPLVGTVGLIVSGIGALALIQPHARVTRLRRVASSFGVAAYVPLTLIYFHIYARVDTASPAPFLHPGPQAFQRAALRLGLFVFIAIMILCLRGAARGLAARSVVVRTGRVDRQSMMALLACFAVAAAGDVLHAVSAGTPNGVLEVVGTVLVAVGSVLVLMGLSNIVLDSLRLWPLIVRRGVGLGDVLEDNARRDRRIKG